MLHMLTIKKNQKANMIDMWLYELDFRTWDPWWRKFNKLQKLPYMCHGTYVLSHKLYTK